jgi:hypothetical protein
MGCCDAPRPRALRRPARASRPGVPPATSGRTHTPVSPGPLFWIEALPSPVRPGRRSGGAGLRRRARHSRDGACGRVISPGFGGHPGRLEPDVAADPGGCERTGTSWGTCLRRRRPPRDSEPQRRCDAEARGVHTGPELRGPAFRAATDHVPRAGEFITRLHDGPGSSAEAGRLNTGPLPRVQATLGGLQPTLLEDQPRHPLPDFHSDDQAGSN